MNQFGTFFRVKERYTLICWIYFCLFEIIYLLHVYRYECDLRELVKWNVKYLLTFIWQDWNNRAQMSEYKCNFIVTGFLSYKVSYN